MTLAPYVRSAEAYRFPKVIDKNLREYSVFTVW